MQTYGCVKGWTSKVRMTKNWIREGFWGWALCGARKRAVTRPRGVMLGGS